MKIEVAVNRLAALAQESRLGLFRLLVSKGPEGMAAGEIAERLKIPPSALSFHLKEMTHVGLLKARKQGRFIYYAPDFKAMNNLMAYLTENCCAGGNATGDCPPLSSTCKTSC